MVTTTTAQQTNLSGPFQDVNQEVKAYADKLMQ